MTEPNHDDAPDATPAASNDATSAEADDQDRCRYDLQESSGKGFLVCRGAPSLRLYVERGLTVTEASRKRYPKQTIFLDGAFGDGPLFDNELRHYSLDHHEGCFRPITLATCEQAAVMILTGLPLSEGHWRLYVNEPDLDALLAAWILLNHAELLKEANELMWQVMPLVRTEGVIDAHGLGHGAISGLSEELYQQQKSRIETLLARERGLKTSGAWETADMLRYGQEMLDDLDRELFPEGYIEQLLDIVEVVQVPIEKRRSSALLCRSRQGIYAVESYLKQRYEKQVGLIVLDQGNGRYTLRQVDSFLQKNLGDLYPVLNELDARVNDGATSKENQDDSANRWGGSTTIGGSPRKTGTALSAEQIMSTIQDVYRGGGWLRRLVRRIK